MNGRLICLPVPPRLVKLDPMVVPHRSSSVMRRRSTDRQVMLVLALNSAFWALLITWFVTVL